MAVAPMAFDEVLTTPTGKTCLCGVKATDHVNGHIYMLVCNHEAAALSKGHVVCHEASYLKGERVDLGDACADGPVAGVVPSAYGSSGVPTGALFWALRYGTISMVAGTNCASLAAGDRVICASLAAGNFRNLPAVLTCVQPSADDSVHLNISIAIRQAGRVFGYVLAAGGGTLTKTESVMVNLESADVY